MARRPLWAILRTLTPKGRMAATWRQSAGAAMQHADWPTAIDQYQRYLGVMSWDTGRRIQLGHALKEAGRHAESLSTYQAVLAVDPHHADLWLSIGHVLKLMGRDEDAVASYRASAEIDGNRHALQELDRLTAKVQRQPQTKSLVTSRLTALIQSESGHLNVTDVVGMEYCERAGGILLSTRDSAISFQPVIGEAVVGKAGSGLAVLKIVSHPVDPARPLTGQIYLDYGDGFSERLSLPYITDGTPVSLLVVAPGLLVGLRWAPDKKINMIRPPTLSFDLITSLSEAEALVDQNLAGGSGIDRLTDVVRSAYAGDVIAPGIAAETSARLLGKQGDPSAFYGHWVFHYETPTTADYARIAALTAALVHKPRFSFVVPVYNTPINLLRECIDSMLAQTYTDFEICLADDCSTDPQIAPLLAEYAADDPRVKVTRSATNGHISATSNLALDLATGDFVVLVDHDDLIPDFALFVVAHYINHHPDADILFSDEDKIDFNGARTDPYFKGAFDRHLMYGHNMVSHLGVYRRSLLREIGGFRLGLEGSQDYDLLLRCLDHTTEDRIIHIPHVLYHWRMTPGSTAVAPDQKSYAIVAAQVALNDHFTRSALPLRSHEGPASGITGVSPAVGMALTTTISIIIPTRNGLDVLKPCIDSVLKTHDGHVEILIIDNGSDDRATLDYLASIREQGLARVLRDDQPFNFSSINNDAAAQATGEILCFLNNDTEVLATDWLDRARALLLIDDVGVVGARLLFPDGKLQHFGIVLGMGAHRVAGTPHGGMAGNDLGYFGKAQLMQEFSAVTAACMFIRKRDFDAVGGFERSLTVAYNDIDLCLKVRARGLKIVGDPKILLIHKESRSRGTDVSGARADRLLREAAWMRDRWAAALDDDRYYSPNLTLERDDFTLARTPRVRPPWHVV